MDCEAGRITHSAPLIPEYTGTEIKKTLEERFHLLRGGNRRELCRACGELRRVRSRGTTISLCLTIGTGIGGAIVIDNQVFHGFSGSGCEIGYMHLPGGEFQEYGRKQHSGEEDCGI